MDLDAAIEEIKEEQGISESVRSVRDGLDDLVDDVISRFVNPEEWQTDTGAKGQLEHAAR